MQTIKLSFIWAVFICLISVIAVLAETSLDIHNINIIDDYQPGVGLPVGNISMVNGEAVIVHRNETTGYPVKQGLDVYRGDTILTGRSGTVIIALLDQSQLSIAADSNIQVNHVEFQPKKRKRNAFVKMSAGKTRFSVRKLKSFSESRFRVKTTTALIGVRGSDFMVHTQSDNTEISAFENTELALTGLAMPDMPPVILHSLERSSVLSGQVPMTPIPLSIEEMDAMKNELILEKQIISKRSSEKASQKSTASSKQQKSIRISEKAEKGGASQVSGVDSDALQPPIMVFTDDASRFENERMDANTYISEQQHEIATELPDFPINP